MANLWTNCPSVLLCKCYEENLIENLRHVCVHTMLTFFFLIINTKKIFNLHLSLQTLQGKQAVKALYLNKRLVPNQAYLSM